MSTYRYNTSIYFALLLFSVGLLTYPSVTSAAPALSVDFQVEPLFDEANVVPGDSETRTVTVENVGTDNEEVYFTVQNEIDDGLADVMQLVVASEGEEQFSGSFANFFGAGEVALRDIAPGTTHTYAFTASLPSGTGNAYQQKGLSFDLVIGFASGESVSDTGGGGDFVTTTSSGSGRAPFVLSAEAVSTLGTSATITWITNRPSTSYVVCGDLVDGPFVLSSNYEEDFGYQFVIPEERTNTQRHSMVQRNLAAGEYECRPASRERTTDRFTVGEPVRFVIPETEVEGAAISQSSSQVPTRPPGSVLGTATKGSAGLTYDEWRAETDRERAEREALEHNELDDPTATITDPLAEDAKSAREGTSVFDRTGNWVNENPVAAWAGGILLIVALLYAGRRYMGWGSGI